MRAVIRGGLVLLALLPATLSAQGAVAASEKHELGLDFTYSYAWRSDDQSSWVMGTPVDIRIGFVTTKPIMYQVGFSLEGGGSGGASSLGGGIGLAALWARDHRSGLYFFGGAAGSFFGVTGEETGFTPSVVAGVGTRLPRGAAAIRLETFVRYATESTTDAPSQTRVGVRAGLSFWH
jgi:hypothetical protein